MISMPKPVTVLFRDNVQSLLRALSDALKERGVVRARSEIM